jgi:hypothetical protein
MPCRPGNAGLAVGAWTNPWNRIQQDQTPQKMRALLWSQLLGGGLRARLWLAVHHPTDGENTALPGTLKCSCVKESGQHADRHCSSCHGVGFAPGYRLFGYETLWVASISPGLILTNVVLDKKIKPYRHVLADGALSGTLETPDLFFTRPVDAGGAWEARSDGIVRDGTQSALSTFFSTDGGATWALLSTLPTANPPSGRIRFRVQFTRSSASVLTPAWEILRARFPTVAAGPRLGPWILVLRNITPQTPVQDPRGVVFEAQHKFWTAPLGMFDPCAASEQAAPGQPLDPKNLIRDPAFLQFLDGAAAALTPPQRWALTNNAWSDPLGYLVRQFFDAREAQPNEALSLVF